jgi:hypothetical protein
MKNRNQTGFFLSALFVSPGALGLLLFLGMVLINDFNPFSWFWLFLLTAIHLFNAFRTTLKNTPDVQVISFTNRESFVEQLTAILTAYDYRLKSNNGSQLVFRPSFWSNWANRRVVVDLRAGEAEINGPSFALDRIEKRFEFFQYPGVSLATVAQKITPP